MKVYLDNAATTMMDKVVLKEMMPYLTVKYGNASSLHKSGREAKEALEKSRKIIAEKINAKAEEIIFTSGGTESNNLALKGAVFANKAKGKHIITTKVEHDCVLNACKWLEKEGYKVTYLNVDNEGFIDIKQLEREITPETVIVSIIHGNNEIGTIQDLEAIGKICRKNNVLFHTDACQSFTKIEIDVEKQCLDLVTINAHKIHGPKGIGALYVRKGVKLVPLNHGGGQENSLRSGTENVAGAAGFAKAVQTSKKQDIAKMAKLRDYMINKVIKEIKDVKLNGPDESNGRCDRRLCNNINISFKFIEGESLLLLLDMEGISVSTGSACSSRSLEPSHVLLATGLKHEIAHGSLRFSLSKYSTKNEIDYTIKHLKKIVERLRKMSPIKK